MKPDHYIHLHVSGTDSSDSAKGDEQIAAQGWWCQSCRSPKPGTGAIDFQIEQKRPVHSPMSFAGGFGVDFVLEDFLALLGEENVARDLMLGTLYGPSGVPIPGWVTVRGRHQVIVRGGILRGNEQWVNSRICETCGNRLYHAYAPRYLYPAPNPDVAILQSQLGGLVVRPDLIEHLGLKRKKGFGIEKLKVLTKPRDGLGDWP